MSGQQEFEALLQRVRNGSDSAARSLVSAYTRHVRHAIRKRLHVALRPKYDSSDFEQSLWASVFADRAGIPQFGSPRELAEYLAQAARNKVAEEARRFNTQRCNLEREVAPGSAILQMDGQQPRPSETVRANDMLERMQDELPESYRAIVELRVAGASHEEIAQSLGVDVKTVQRMLRRIERQFGM